MSNRFNKTKSTKTKRKTNFAGVSDNYAKTPKSELISFMLNEYSGFSKDAYYESADDSYNRFIDLLDQTIEQDPLFVAKLAIFSRGGRSLVKSLDPKFANFAGGKLRTVSHIAAARLAKKASGKEWARSFYNKIVERVDDMTEIAAYYFKVMEQERLSNAIKYGFREAFSKFDRHQLAKYRGDKKEVKLIDIVRLVHPVETDKHSGAISDLYNGKLRVDSTWEAKLSSAGKTAKTAEEKQKAKADGFNDLLSESRIGGLALLRNARNIIETNDMNVVKNYVKELGNKKNFRMVLPTEILKSYDAVRVLSQSKATKMVMAALSNAVDFTAPNIEFEGSTAVIIDGSGSMESTATGAKTSFNMKQLAAFFGASLHKKNQFETEVVLFGDTAKMVDYHDMNDAIDFAQSRIKSYHVGHSTNMSAAFNLLKNKHERIVVISDMQVTRYGVNSAFEDYKRRTGGNPKLYLWDLHSYGTTPIKKNGNVIDMSGWSFDCFNLIANSEVSPNELEKVINSITI